MCFCKKTYFFARALQRKLLGHVLLAQDGAGGGQRAHAVAVRRRDLHAAGAAHLDVYKRQCLYRHPRRRRHLHPGAAHSQKSQITIPGKGVPAAETSVAADGLGVRHAQKAR